MSSAVQHKPLAEQVIVVTGASSGIGLATARAAAEGGARLVLTSRNAAFLSRLAEEIRQDGGEAIAVAADVGRRGDLERVAEAAISRFGGFDTWINNAGVGIFGRIDEISDADHHRLFETNFWGVVYGSTVAAEGLKRRGGAIVNLGSIASDIVFPMQGMYCASKHAIKGFTDAFRMELEAEDAPISVTLIKPAAIDTPFPQHSKNYTDREMRLPPPVYRPEEVANAILHAAVHGGRDIYIGGGGKAISSLNKHLPGLVDLVGSRAVPIEFRQEPPRNPAGSLHAPSLDGQVRGDHPGYVMKTSLYTRATLHPLATGLLSAGALLAAGIVAGLRRRGAAKRRRW